MATAEAEVLVWVSEYHGLKHVSEGLCWAKAALGSTHSAREVKGKRKGCRVLYEWSSPQLQKRGTELATAQSKNCREDKAVPQS